MCNSRHTHRILASSAVHCSAYVVVRREKAIGGTMDVASKHLILENMLRGIHSSKHGGCIMMVILRSVSLPASRRENPGARDRKKRGAYGALVEFCWMG